MVYTKPFESVYQHYPKKKGKFQAQKTWTKLNDAGELPEPEKMISAIAAQKKERVFLKKQNRFVPPWKHFSTWLNAGCFDDEVELQVCRTLPKNSHGNGLDNMQRALNILTNVGEEKFHEFCEGVGMPANDKEAVLNKHNMRFNASKLATGILRGV